MKYYRLARDGKLIEARARIAADEQLRKRFLYLPLEETPQPECPVGSRIAKRYEMRDAHGRKTILPHAAVKIVSVYEIFPPRTFSKLKIIVALTEMGVWPQVRDYIVEAGLYDLFLAAQDFREDDRFFARGLSELRAQLQMTDAQIEGILRQAEA